jgi:hypothetical protein
LHRSSFAELEFCEVEVSVRVGVIRSGSTVGDGVNVSVGSDVGVAVSVGGICVVVGIAAWVSATMVNAAAAAVSWMSSLFRAGSFDCVPHAQINRLNIAILAQRYLFI